MPRRERAQRRHDRSMGVDVLRMAVLAIGAVGDDDVWFQRADLLGNPRRERGRVGVDRQRLAADLHPRVDEVEEPDLASAERPTRALHLDLAKLAEARLRPNRRLADLATLTTSGAEDVQLVALGCQLRQIAGPEELVVRVGGDCENGRHYAPPSAAAGGPAC